MNEDELLQTNNNLSRKLDKLKDVEFQLRIAHEKLEQQNMVIDDLRQSKLKIDSVLVTKHGDSLTYRGQITDIMETQSGLVIGVTI
jgi:hypothetical protein